MQQKRCKSSSLIRGYLIHSHPEWEIIYQIEGEAKTQVGDTVCDVVAGDVLIIPPHTPHRGFSNEVFRDCSLKLKEADFPGFVHFRDYRGDICALMFMLLRLETEQEGDYRAVSDSLTRAVYNVIKYELGIASGSPAVAEIKNAIYENLSNPEFKLADRIADTGFDKDYFRRCFKRETGKTPSQYLTELRLTHAKQLLSDQKRYSIESIAYSCGFSDSLYFSTCFKKHEGMSPLNYRKKLWDETMGDRVIF